MINGKKVFAFIPARGGSKRLPRKNILPLAGKPLIAWTIDAAINSSYIDQVFVSTDDVEIADISCSYGADVPELRPSDLASDTATTESVLLYTLEKFALDADIVIILQPTSPLRQAQHINQALDIFEEKNAFSVVSVTPCEHSPLWANTLPASGSMGDFLRPEALQRTQDLKEYFRLNGAIYIYDVKRIKELQQLAYLDDSFAFKMENLDSIDIDTKFDFDLATYFLGLK